MKEILSLRHRCNDMHLLDAISPTRLYNNNQGTVDRSKGTSAKGMLHINLKDCAVRDSIQAKKVDLCHIRGEINPSDIFTKDMCGRSHFRTLCNSFMVSAKKICTFVTSSSPWMSASWMSGINLAASAA